MHITIKGNGRGPLFSALAATILALIIAGAIIFEAVLSEYLSYLGFSIEDYGSIRVEYGYGVFSIRITDISGDRIDRVYLTVYAFSPDKGLEFIGSYISLDDTIVITGEGLSKLKNIGLLWSKVLGDSYRYSRISIIVFADIIDDEGKLYSIVRMIPVRYYILDRGLAPSIKVFVNLNKLKVLRVLESGNLTILNPTACRLRREVLFDMNTSNMPLVPYCRYYSGRCSCRNYYSVWKLEKLYYINNTIIPITLIGLLEDPYVLLSVYVSLDGGSKYLEAVSALKTAEQPLEYGFSYIFYSKEKSFWISASDCYGINSITRTNFLDKTVLAIGVHGSIVYGVFRRYEILEEYKDNRNQYYSHSVLTPTKNTSNILLWIPSFDTEDDHPVLETSIVVEDNIGDDTGFLEKYYSLVKKDFRVERSIEFSGSGYFSYYTSLFGFDAIAVLRALGLNISFSEDQEFIGGFRLGYPASIRTSITVRKEYSPSIIYYSLGKSLYRYRFRGETIEIPLYFFNITDVYVRLASGYSPLNKWALIGMGYNPHDFAMVYKHDLLYKIKAFTTGDYAESYGYVTYRTEVLLPGVLTLTSTIDYDFIYSINGSGRVELKYYVEVIDANTGSIVYSKEYILFSYDTGSPLSLSLTTQLSGTRTYTTKIPLKPGEYYVRIYIIAIAKAYDDSSTAIINAYDNGYIDVDLSRSYIPNEE